MDSTHACVRVPAPAMPALMFRGRLEVAVVGPPLHMPSHTASRGRHAGTVDALSVESVWDSVTVLTSMVIDGQTCSVCVRQQTLSVAGSWKMNGLRTSLCHQPSSSVRLPLISCSFVSGVCLEVLSKRNVTLYIQ